jgi:hypothetical protein
MGFPATSNTLLGSNADGLGTRTLQDFVGYHNHYPDISHTTTTVDSECPVGRSSTPCPVFTVVDERTDRQIFLWDILLSSVLFPTLSLFYLIRGQDLFLCNSCTRVSSANE